MEKDEAGAAEEVVSTDRGKGNASTAAAATVSSPPVVSACSGSAPGSWRRRLLYDCAASEPSCTCRGAGVSRGAACSSSAAATGSGSAVGGSAARGRFAYVCAAREAAAADMARKGRCPASRSTPSEQRERRS